MNVELAGLGRKVPTDFTHVSKYRANVILPTTVPEVNKSLSLPAYRRQLDQGQEGACVGFSETWAQGILNRRLYDATWLWQEARLTDEWPDNDDLSDWNQGTSVRAGFEVLRTQGHRHIFKSVSQPAKLSAGIEGYRWATSVDEIRTSIANNTPVVLGINWYSNFDRPTKIGRWYWIAADDNWGQIRGGHAICIYGAHDSHQGVRLINTWGYTYPKVFIPYNAVERLLSEYGEAGLIVDNIGK